MNTDSSYLTARLAERRRRVLSGVAGIGVLLALGWGLLLSYPTPDTGAPGREPSRVTAHADSATGSTTTALR